MIHEGMSNDLFQGQGQVNLKRAKMADFKSYLLRLTPLFTGRYRLMHIIKRLTTNYDTPTVDNILKF